MSHAYTNRLAQEKSPYLLQHAHNPVEWLPWGEEAFERARREDKPIFLSVGYSTCHWCHVMERESFEVEAVAQVMNEHFINIKVDREERPDVDRVYMTFVQATTGSGGWPMSVWLTPELKPFYGGTYFPPTDSYGRPGFITLLQHLAEAWRTDREGIERSAQSVTDALQNYAALEPASDADNNWLAIADRCYHEIRRAYDERFGGFGDAPKFPRPVVHDFLHAYSAVTGESRALGMSLRTLAAMCDGGMNDQLGGGFHRYGVDEQWIVSHFEKMLYDQAQIVMALLEAYHFTGEEYLAQSVRQTLDYVLRDMTHERGGFYAAEDADSLPTHDAAHKEEGAFYVWTQAEIREVLGEDAPLFEAFYGVKSGGNAPASGDPHGEFKDKNILFRSQSIADAAAQIGIEPEAAALRLQRAAEKLFELRQHRPRPHRDEKIIASWNGLMISAFARAGQLLEDTRYLDAALQAALFIHDELWDVDTQTLQRHYKDGAADVAAFADDYAALALACLDLYAASFDVAHLRWAEQLLATLNRLFWDEKDGGYFSTASDPSILIRQKDDYDGAEPSANSLAALALLRCSTLLEHFDFRTRAERTLNTFVGRVAQTPHAMPELLRAALIAQEPPQHLVIVGHKQTEETRRMLQVAGKHSSLALSIILRDEDDKVSIAYWNKRAPWTRTMTMREGTTTAYLCHNFVCEAPTSNLQDLQL